TYRFQAVLDRNTNYNYRGRGGGDLVSDTVDVALPGKIPTLTLSRILPEVDTKAALAQLPPEARARIEQGLKRIVPIDFISPSLSAFWGRPIHMRGSIALPPGYDAKARTSYPVAYSTHGFGGSALSQEGSAAGMASDMAAGTMPAMIWVYLDESSATGTHEFADSVNNGPWGKALTSELIPALEKQYRMDARPGSRFLTGHSSGGWATLWLQVAYPAMFGGTWPTSPDSSDFHDFTNANLYAANANLYTGADGKPLPLVRDKGKMVASLRQFAQQEAALGAYGGQFASFEWVFSPKGPDGRPVQLFDRATGNIDPAVAAYWREHYDIAHIVARDWRRLKPNLDGKIHLIVGDADTFYLDGAAHRLQAVLDKLGARSSFRFVPGKTHFDLFERGGDRNALMKDIAWEMYAVARPGSKRP
ncbi:MAG: enterochelin esterase, partial [Sphingomonadales bacterium]